MEDKYEEILTYWVCPACGYIEEADIEEEDTPVKVILCPDCGADMHRLNSIEIFHLGVGEDEEHNEYPPNFIKVDDIQSIDLEFPQVRDEDQELPQVLQPRDVITLVMGASRYVFVDRMRGRESLRERVIKTLVSSQKKAMRLLRSEAMLVSIDGKSRYPFGYGVFGVFDTRGTLADRIGRGERRVSVRECKCDSPKLIRDNGKVLTIQVDNRKFGFIPRDGFPFDSQVVSSSVFEDFVRRYKNLPVGRRIPFLLSNGKIVSGLDKSNIQRIIPKSRDAFLEITDVLDEVEIVWSGGMAGIYVEKDYVPLVEGLIDEDTVSGDVDPGYVVKKGQMPDYDQFEKIIKSCIEGKPVRMDMSKPGKITFTFESDERNIELEGMLSEALVMLGDANADIAYADGEYCIKMSIGADEIQSLTLGD